MAFLHNLRLWLFPIRITDPELGNLVFMYSSKFPERSYWECEWTFPTTGTTVALAIPGTEDGPQPEARMFYLSLPARFEKILALCRPPLEEVFGKWLGQSLPEDTLGVLELSGFGLEDSRERPVRWNVSFETTGEKWLSITIPFVGDTPGEALVDT